MLLENGDVLAFGHNNYGQLGLGTAAERWYPTETPTKIAGLGKVQALSAGQEHSLVLLENGDVYGFGRNTWGELGRPPSGTYNPTPTKIEGIEEVQVISAGFNFSYILVGIERDIVINIDNKPLHTDVPPVVLHGRTMVPLRAIFEALDMNVEYISESRTIIGTKGDSRIELAVDSTKAIVNGEERVLDVPATIIESRTLVPVRFIAESTGREVIWEGITRTVRIN